MAPVAAVDVIPTPSHRCAGGAGRAARRRCRRPRWPRGSARPASASTTTCARWSAAGSWSSSRSGRGAGCTERVVRATCGRGRGRAAVVGDVPAEQDRFAADALLAGGARLVRDVAAARRAADERGQRLLTFAIEAEVGFDAPVRPRALRRRPRRPDRRARRRVRSRPSPLPMSRRRSPRMTHGQAVSRRGHRRRPARRRLARADRARADPPLVRLGLRRARGARSSTSSSSTRRSSPPDRIEFGDGRRHRARARSALRRPSSA